MSSDPAPFDPNMQLNHHSNVSNDIECDSDSDTECSDLLMGLFDNVKSHTMTPIDSFDFRNELSVTLQLRDFKLNAHGHCNFRDGTVLGKPPGIVVPSELSHFETILLSIYLEMDYDNHDMVMRNSCGVSAPVFCLDSYKASHSEVHHRNPCGTHQLWIKGSSLPDDMTVLFKKKNWNLSRAFRKVSKQQWPAFTIVATPAVDGVLQYSKSIRTPKFEVRSKEQANKTSASRGLHSLTKSKKRRTPQTASALLELQKLQTNIIQIRREIEKTTQLNREYEMRCAFMVEMSGTESRFAQINQSLKTNLSKIRALSEKRIGL